MAGSQPGRLLPWVGGRFVEVAEFDDLAEPWADRVVAQVGVADPGTVAAALDAAAAARSQMAGRRPASSKPARMIWRGRSPKRPAR